MQPEINEQTMTGEKVVQEKPKQQPTPIQEWDQLSFQVIYNELVPKGFKTQKNGMYRGTEYVEVPKKAVLRTQKIGAQLVRGFRDKAKKEVQEFITAVEVNIARYETNLNNCSFWHFSRRQQLKRGIENLHERLDVGKIILERLNEISIK